MQTIALVTSLLVLCGAVFMVFAIMLGQQTKGQVPTELQRRWRILIVLMFFFLAGYLLFAAILLSNLKFPTELVTGPVFLGGACFVYIVVNLALDTIGRIRAAEQNLRLLNDSLEQRVAERTMELQRSQEFLKTILDSLNDGVSIIDVRDFSIIAVNAPFLKECGMREEEVIGRTCYAITHNRHEVCEAPDDICPLLETVASGKHGMAEHVHYGVGGEKLYVEVSTSPILDKDGRIIQVAHVSRDITERKRGEEKLQRYAADLQETNKELTAFTNLVSHDLRAPLVNIKGFADELELTLMGVEGALNDYTDPLDEKAQNLVHKAFRKELPEALQFIKESAGRMDSLINAMLKLARFGSRRQRLEPVEMNDLVQTVILKLSTQREQHNAQVTVGWLPEVVADRIAVEQIMEYLLDNALKYLMPERPGVIEIIAERGEKETIFQICDNGRGIAAEDMHKVFELFRRAGQHAVPGEGMGLAYVKTLVRRHGGRLWCESELGVGSTFSFSISHKLDIAE